RSVNKDGFVQEWPDVGLMAMESSNDPAPSIAIENGKVTELDGKNRDEFDFMDRFIADYSINLDKAEEVMKTDSMEYYQMLVDINCPREKIIPLTTSMTPAKIVEIVSNLNVVEMMMALQKMRARKTPSNQCHVTNVKEHPAQIAADAAEAAIRGFDEMETTMGVVRYAPSNAIAILVGAQSGRGGVITQCSVEEATELELGMRGLSL